MDQGQASRVGRLKHVGPGAASSSHACTPTGALHERRNLVDADVRLRIEELEHEVNFGRCAFLVLGDLLNNVRNNGGMTAELIDNTFAELVAYFRASTPEGNHPMVKYVEAMRSGDSST